MKKILLPIDFSDNAYRATDYALQLANAFGSTITLVHLYKVYSTTGMFISVESYMKEEAGKEMLGLLNQLEPKLKAPAKVESKIVRGEAVPVIANMADTGGYDLVVMGTQGATGLREVFIGSTTNAVMRKTRTPVLAIPQGYTFRPIRNIVLAMDERSISDATVVRVLLQLARQFGAAVRVYHQEKGPNDPGLDPSVDIFLENIVHTYHYELDINDINKSINDFVAKSQADLLCMIKRHRGFLRNLFHVSVTKQEAFHSEAPLLVLHDTE